MFKTKLKRIIALIVAIVMLFTTAVTTMSVISADTTYDYTIDLSAPYSLSDNTVWAMPRVAYSGNNDYGQFGYDLMVQSGSNYAQAVGDVVFKFNGSASDLIIYGVAGDANWAGSYSFYASSDGTNWDEVTALKQEVAANTIEPPKWNWITSSTHHSAWGTKYYKWTATLNESLGYKYLKITFTNGTFTNVGVATVLRQIIKIDYNVADVPIEYHYAVTPEDESVTSTPSENGCVANITSGNQEGFQINNSWTFCDQNEEYNGGYIANRNGEFVFESNDGSPIIAYSLTGYRMIYDAGIAISISTDGTNWSSVSPTIKDVETSTAPYAKSVWSDVLGVEDDIKYIKVSLTSYKWSKLAPGICSLSYRTEKGDVALLTPQKVEYTRTGETETSAKGKIKITANSAGKTPESFVAYWADENGPLTGVDAIANINFTGSVTEYTISDNVIIPDLADRIIVCAKLGDTYSNYVTAVIPEIEQTITPQEPESYTYSLDLSNVESKTDGTEWVKPKAEYNGNNDYGGFGYNLLRKVGDKWKPADGEVVFKFDKALTDIVLYGVAGDTGWAGSYDFYVSSDKTNWTAVTTATEEIAANLIEPPKWDWITSSTHHNAWGTKYYKWFANLDGESGYKYLKIEFSNGTFDADGVSTVLRQVIRMDYNTASPIEQPDVPATPENPDTPENPVTPQEPEKYLYSLDLSEVENKTEGTEWVKPKAEYNGNNDYGGFGYNLLSKVGGKWMPANGEIVFLLEGNLTDIVLYGVAGENTEWAGKYEFYVSSDKINWSSVTVATEEIAANTIAPPKWDWIRSSTHHNAWGTKYYKWYANLDGNLGYKYLKVKLSNGSYDGDGVATALRQLMHVAYNIDIPTVKPDISTLPNEYLFSLDIASPTNLPNNTVWDMPSSDYGGNNDFGKFGYNLMVKTDNKWLPAEGDVIFEFEGAVTDFALYGIATDSDWGGKYKFYVSSDKEDWTLVDISASEIAANLIEPPKWNWIESSDHRYAAWGTKFYKWAGSFNGSDGYKYLKIELVNGYPLVELRQIIKFVYNADGVEIPQKQNRYQYEVSIDADNTDIITECDEDVVLDSPQRFNSGWGPYKVYTFQKGRIDINSGTHTKADGNVIIKSDKAITDWCFGGVDDVGDWGGYFTFFASKDGENWDEIKYLKEMGEIFFNPWGAYEWEYYGSLNVEDGYKYLKITSNTGSFNFLPCYNYLQYSTAGYDPNNILPANSYINRMELSNYFYKDGNIYTFKSGTAMANADLHVIEPISDTSAITALTEDGFDFVKRATRKLVKNNGDGTGEYRYYDSFYASDNILKIAINLANAKFLYLDYNLISGEEDTERRHYEDIPIVEPIEDLDLPSVFTAYYKRHTNGILANIGGIAHDNGEQNEEWCGGRYGFLPIGGRDFYLIMQATYLRDFKLRFSYSNENTHKVKQIKCYVRETFYGEETEVPLVRYESEEWKSAHSPHYIIRPADRDFLKDKNFNFVRIEVLSEEGTGDYSELMDFEYFYELPEIETMPDFEPVEKGMKEVIDNFDSPNFMLSSGGKVFDSYNVLWENHTISGFNEDDNIIRQEVFGADAYIVYNYKGINRLDIRGYKNPSSEIDLVIEASPDGEEWETIEVTEYIEKSIYENWRKIAYKLDNSVIPIGTNFVRFNVYSDAESETDIMISDVQIQYSDIDLIVEDDDSDDTKTEDKNDNSDDFEKNTEIKDENKESVSENIEEIINDDDEIKDYYRKVIRRRRVYNGLSWWMWLIIAVGSIAVIVGSTTIIIILVKKKQKIKLLK